MEDSMLLFLGSIICPTSVIDNGYLQLMEDLWFQGCPIAKSVKTESKLRCATNATKHTMVQIK